MAENMDFAVDSEAELLTLLDEDGAEHQFEVVDSAELDGRRYMALIPVFDNPDEFLQDSGELVILRIGEEDDEEFLEVIEDEDEFNNVGDFFMGRLSDQFDFTDGED